MVANPPTVMTPEQFRQLPESTQPTELIAGELIVSRTPINKHQKAVGEIYYFLKQLENQNLVLGQAILSPMDVWLGKNAVQPDVFWVSRESRCTLGEDGYWYGAPDLVIEVLSPSTANRDRGVKFELYQQFGVREYWMADPEGLYFEVYQLEDGKFARLGVFGVGQSFVSVVLGQRTIEVGQFLKG